jgi:hypothetical protein
MKTHQTSIFGLLSIALVFTACQKDGIVDMDLLENKSDRVETQELDPNMSRSIPVPVNFELQQMVDIQKPDCATSSSLEEGSQDQVEKSEGCYGTYGLSSQDGRGWVEDFGSFTSHVDLEYDPTADEINGTVTIVFDRESATLVLKAMGRVLKTATPSEGRTLVVGLESTKFSKPYDMSNFIGQIHIMRADLITDSKSLENDALMVINGEFGVEARDPGDYAIEHIHNSSDK